MNNFGQDGQTSIALTDISVNFESRNEACRVAWLIDKYIATSNSPLTSCTREHKDIPSCDRQDDDTRSLEPGCRDL